MASGLTGRQQRWLDALLILATIAVGFVVLGSMASLFFYFGDVVLVFFLAWLLAFILSPIVGWLVRHIPSMPRVVAVVLVYAVLLGSLSLLVLFIADALASSISQFIARVPQLRQALSAILDPWQYRIRSIGLGQVSLGAKAQAFVANLSDYAAQLVGPVQQLAVASLGALGNLLLVLILSLYMIIDHDRILSVLFRLVPPRYGEEARLLETSISRSFGGFLRGQALLGITYGLVATVASAVFGLEYLAFTSALSGVLMSIPFFGPFISWLPPVLVALVLHQAVLLPTFVTMIVGWFIVMNILQPR